MADLTIASIVMPVRNEAGLIEGSLTSVLALDCPMAHVEILAGYGRGEDGTRQTVEDFVRPNHSVHLLGDPDRIEPIERYGALKVARGRRPVRLNAQSNPSQGAVPESKQRKAEGL
jgi:hypothetical protein